MRAYVNHWEIINIISMIIILSSVTLMIVLQVFRIIIINVNYNKIKSIDDTDNKYIHGTNAEIRKRKHESTLAFMGRERNAICR